MLTIITEINDKFNLDDFECDNEDVNIFLKKYALNNHKKHLSKVYVLIEEELDKLIGYMTLSASALRLPDSKKYEIHEVPAVLLGRIGIDNKYRGKNYAEKYLIPYAVGISKAVTNSIGCRLLIAQINQDDPILTYFLNIGFNREPDSRRYHNVSIDLFTESD